MSSIVVEDDCLVCVLFTLLRILSLLQTRLNAIKRVPMEGALTSNYVIKRFNL